MEKHPLSIEPYCSLKLIFYHEKKLSIFFTPMYIQIYNGTRCLQRIDAIQRLQ